MRALGSWLCCCGASVLPACAMAQGMLETWHVSAVGYDVPLISLAPLIGDAVGSQGGNYCPGLNEPASCPMSAPNPFWLLPPDYPLHRGVGAGGVGAAGGRRSRSGCRKGEGKEAVAMETENKINASCCWVWREVGPGQGRVSASLRRCCTPKTLPCPHCHAQVVLWGRFGTNQKQKPTTARVRSSG